MRISDWSSDVCSSDLFGGAPVVNVEGRGYPVEVRYRALGSESLSPDDSSGRQFRKGESDSDPISVLDGILAACDEIARARPMGTRWSSFPGTATSATRTTPRTTASKTARPPRRATACQ